MSVPCCPHDGIPDEESQIPINRQNDMDNSIMAILARCRKCPAELVVLDPNLPSVIDHVPHHLGLPPGGCSFQGIGLLSSKRRSIWSADLARSVVTRSTGNCEHILKTADRR